jgi:6-phosphogluconolactonase (cycloisomerase 2 family)
METRSSRLATKILAAVTLLMLQACGGNGDLFGDLVSQLHYSVGGTVTGLAGSGLVLRNNGGDDLGVAANGSFTFATRLPTGTSYDVTVFAQPSNPSQTCVVAAGTGNWSGSPVTTVAVSCTTNTYTVGGTVSGLKGSGLVLRNNGGDDLPVNDNGAFAFPGKVASGDSYDVIVSTQPTNPAQICSSTDAGGTVGDTDVATVMVVCGSIGRFVYSSSAGPGGGSSQTYISAYAIDASTGALSAVPGSPFVYGYRSQLRVTPSSRFAYAHGYDNWIYGYAIDSVTGALSSVPGSAFPAPSGSPGPQASMVFDPSSRFMYAANVDGDVYGYAINAVTGALTPVPGSPFAAGADPGPAVIDAKGQFLYVPNSGSDNVSAFSINPVSGTLAPIAGSPFVSESEPYDITFTPDGKLAYVAYLATENVSAYSVDSISGALTALAVIPFLDTHRPPRFTPNSRFAYWASASEEPGSLYRWAKTVSGFAVNTATGALTPVPGSQHAICCVPSDALLHPSGKFLYVPSGYTIPGSSRIYGFAIDGSTGALEPLDGSPFFCCSGRTFGLTIDASGRLGFEGSLAAGFGDLRSFVIDPVTGKLSGGDSVAVGFGGGGAVIAY